ncbi:glycosyl transferase [Marinithermofilum abyssi]|jgi:glycosyltransferase involved in cell wall biosynthesis|uniref:Glycosyl transferase n=1 Tax=Marinithermofilum abyssi TaxID=1571185 RepID=A0A8J2VFT1_9BACL|nr:glycosyltransferase [Marinithermofilum abyssi]GGE23146.1 glycosyl transferase [Marinithermofilum abyssi]
MKGVSVITCTIRPNQIQNIFRNYARQTFNPKELIIILNRKNMGLRRWVQIAKKFKNVRVYKKSGVPLGVCLNFGIRKARYPIIAKLDDDDYYAPKYLTQAVHALKTTNASLVGKDAHTTYFEGKKLVAVYRPHMQNRYTHHVGGGTFVFKKNVFPRVKFPARTLGEDIIFQQRLVRKGYKIYSTDRYHYVSIRRKNKRTHTWKESDKKGLRHCKIIARSKNYRSYV